MKEPKKENILELVDKSKVARVPPLILNNAVIDSSVLDSTENTYPDLVKSLHLSSPEYKCDDCPSAFSTNQELLLHNLEDHFSGEIEIKAGEKLIN